MSPFPCRVPAIEQIDGTFDQLLVAVLPGPPAVALVIAAVPHQSVHISHGAVLRVAEILQIVVAFLVRTEGDALRILLAVCYSFLCIRVEALLLDHGRVSNLVAGEQSLVVSLYRLGFPDGDSIIVGNDIPLAVLFLRRSSDIVVGGEPGSKVLESLLRHQDSFLCDGSTREYHQASHHDDSEILFHHVSFLYFTFSCSCP